MSDSRVVDWNPYLESVCTKYAQWWDVYTLTDVAGKMRSPDTSSCLMNLRVQTVKESRKDRKEEQEQYGVLEGLRKYAANHVLLVGRPGSGKSTAFARLLLEESEKAQGLLADHSHQEKIIQIPILVELRYYETSIIDLILQFLKRHDLMIDSSELKTILLGKANIYLLLLFDGVNELPSEKGRLDLQRFRKSYGKVSMIFSTRNIGLGGDLNLEKKFEMLPLTEPQMRQFVRAYLPEKGEAMIKQLGDRLREFGQTPLLLWMLCSVFESNDSQIPSNLGLVFRQFTEIYDHKLKADVSTFQESREWWRNLLQILAWKMMEGQSKTEIKVAISRREAELILTTFVLDQGFPKHYAKKWLDDLLKHHLIQLEGNDQISFRHQLIQEYYAAETLLEKISEEEISKLSDEVLQWNYLNYLKWTEPFSLMLGMIEDKTKAIHLVKLALDVDIRLGARLAGEIKKDWHETTIDLILVLKLPQLFTIDLLGRTRSDAAITWLIKALKDDDPLTYVDVAYNIAKIGSKLVIPDLMKILRDVNFHVRVRGSAINILGKIGTEEVIPQLVEAFQDSSPNIRSEVIEAIGKIRSQEILKQNSSKSILDLLNKALDDPDDYVRHCATYFLNKDNLKVSEYSSSYIPGSDNNHEEEINTNNLEPKTVIAMLLNILENSDFSSSDVFGAIKTLKNFGKIDMEMAIVISQLNERIKNSDWVKLNNGYPFIYAIQSLDAIQKEIGYYQPNPKPMNKKIYISYNWQEDSNEIANQIVQAFEAKGIEVIRDKTHTSYKDSIKKFMQKIGQGQCVIAVISDRYLKSPNCMFELVEIAKNEDLYNRIFPIVLPDAKIYDDENRLDYYLYWEEKKAKLQDKYKKVDLLGTESIMETLKLYDDIRRNIDNLTHTFKVMNTLNKDLHRQSEFGEMIQAVEAKLAEDSQHSSVSPSQIPTLSPQSVTYDLRGANIGNLAHNVQGDQQTNQPEKP